MTRRIGPVRRLLIKAKALIDTPEHWCKGTFAKSAKGREVSTLSALARKFCPWGAILRAAESDPGCFEDEALGILESQTGTNNIALVNDAPETTHPMIMRLFNKAIRAAKEQGI